MQRGDDTCSKAAVPKQSAAAQGRPTRQTQEFLTTDLVAQSSAARNKARNMLQLFRETTAADCRCPTRTGVSPETRRPNS